MIAEVHLSNKSWSTMCGVNGWTTAHPDRATCQACLMQFLLNPKDHYDFNLGLDLVIETDPHE